MLQKLILLPLAAIALLSGVVGCTVVREYPAEEKAAENKQLEHELARELLHAFVTNDSAKFVSLLPVDMGKKFDEAAFRKYREKLVKSVGEPISFTYLTTLELQALTPQIWKVRFRRVNSKNGQEFTSEVLFRVITGMSDKNNAVITSFQFI